VLGCSVMRNVLAWVLAALAVVATAFILGGLLILVGMFALPRGLE
jgi:hypothetical protein